MEKENPNNSMASTAAPESPFRSPISSFDNPSPSSSPAIITWSARADPPPAEASMEGSRSVAAILRRDRTLTAVMKAAIAVRVAATVLCLISFSVMAADKNKGWTLDSFDRYNEYRYCLAVNVIGFVYAGFQAFAEVHHLVHKKHFINPHIGFYFDFAMDQILAYLLISASSSATSSNNYWLTNWGSDPFPNMISVSFTISFFAFMAFAISSHISAYSLFSSRTF